MSELIKVIALAERVMGWKAYERYDIQHNTYLEFDGDGRQWWEGCKGGGDRDDFQASWNPFTSIADAMELIECGEWDFAISKSRGDGVYTVAIFNSVWSLARERCSVPELGNPNLYAKASDESVVRAITSAVWEACCK